MKARDLRHACLRSAKRDLQARLSRGSFQGSAATLETLGDYAMLTESPESRHRDLFGEHDAEYGRYGTGYRKSATRGLPRHVRALLAVSRLLARLPASTR